MTLVSKKCVPCEGGTPPLSLEDVAKFKQEINPEWNIVENKKMSRLWTFPDFKTAMVFVDRVAELAESENHHPDIDIRYSKVLIALSTHAAHGLTENDFIVAAKIDEIASLRSR